MYIGEELIDTPTLNMLTVNATSTTNPSIKDMIPSISDEDLIKFEVAFGKLKYIGEDAKELAWAEALGLRIATTTLTEEEYNVLYENEIAMALKYGTVTNGVYKLNSQYGVNDEAPPIELPAEAAILALPYGVTTLGEYAFSLSSITTVIMPETVTVIENNAFDDCDNIKKLVLPNSITSIGELAFYDCSGLIEVVIPSNVTTMGLSTFLYAKNLKNVYIEATTCKIGVYTFDGIATDATIYVRNDTVENAIKRSFEDSDVSFEETGITIVNNTTWVAPTN